MKYRRNLKSQGNNSHGFQERDRWESGRPAIAECNIEVNKEADQNGFLKAVAGCFPLTQISLYFLFIWATWNNKQDFFLQQKYKVGKPQ